MPSDLKSISNFIKTPQLMPAAGSILVLWAEESKEISSVESWGRKIAIVIPMILIGLVQLVDVVASMALGLLVLALDLSIFLAINIAIACILPVTRDSRLFYSKMILWDVTTLFFERAFNGVAITYFLSTSYLFLKELSKDQSSKT